MNIILTHCTLETATKPTGRHMLWKYSLSALLKVCYAVLSFSGILIHCSRLVQKGSLCDMTVVFIQAWARCQILSIKSWANHSDDMVHPVDQSGLPAVPKDFNRSKIQTTVMCKIYNLLGESDKNNTRTRTTKNICCHILRLSLAGTYSKQRQIFDENSLGSFKESHHKEEPPTLRNWLDVIEEIHDMESLTHTLGIQRSTFEERWKNWPIYKTHHNNCGTLCMCIL